MSDHEAEQTGGPLAAFISAEDLAKTLGITKAALSVWRRERQLPGIKVGARTFFYLPSVATWLRAQETTQAAD